MRARRPISATLSVTQSQNMASAFGGLATPPLMFNGQLVTKKVHLFCFRHSSDSASRSHSSPNGVPHSARALSWIPVHAAVSVLIICFRFEMPTNGKALPLARLRMPCCRRSKQRSAGSTATRWNLRSPQHRYSCDASCNLQRALRVSPHCTI